MYNRAVRETTAIFDTAQSDLAGRRAWIEKRQRDGFPVLVALIDGALAGFASFGEFRAGEGYRSTVGNLIYVDPAQQRTGIGRALLTALVDRARVSGKHSILAEIAAENLGSIALHRALDFREVGRLPQAAEKFGSWHDLVFFQIILNERGPS